MKEEKIETNCRSGVTLTLNVGQATPDRKKLLIQRQVSPDLQTANGWMFLPKHCQAKPDLRRGQRGGFTLIELLVVVLIIGILAAVALPQYNKAVDKSRFATVKGTLNAIATAEQIYFMANGTYSSDLEELDLSPSNCQLNDSKSSCDYHWGYCYLACIPGGSCGGCLLHLKQSSWVIFMSEIGWQTRACYASKGSTRAYQLCQSETGKKTPDHSSSQYDIFKY